MIRLAAILALLIAFPASAATYVVSYNPYSGVKWSTTERCRTQLHDHINSTGEVDAYDDDGYCAITWMDYAGYYSQSTGSLVGMGSPRQWPPTDYGAPALPGSYTNLKFYIPGAEEVGNTSTGDQTSHIHSTFMLDYIEGAGCDSCGPGSSALPPTSGIPSTHLYDSDQEQIDLINEFGGFAILNHPTLGDGWEETGWGAIAILNTFQALRDIANGGAGYNGITNRIETARKRWDAALDTRHTRIWAVAANDRYSSFIETPLDGTSDANLPDTVTAAHVDQGKIEVFLPDKNLDDFETAFRAGAFVAVREDENASTKGLYPVLTNVVVTTASITLTTSAGDETVTWYANPATPGTLESPNDPSTQGTGFSLDLGSLDSGLTYVRAEISDGSGRTTYTQPFSLRAPQPRASGRFGLAGSP